MQATKRIDAGIKRGPKTRLAITKSGDPISTYAAAIPEGLSPIEVIQRYLTEESTSQIARSYGVSRKTLVRWLRATVPNEWRDVQLIRAHDRKETGNENLEAAADPLSLARAREIVRSAQWELQALDPDYRPKQDIQVEHVGDLGERLRRARERVIEPESVVQEQQKG